VYNWSMKRKIYNRYRLLQRLENKVGLVPFEELMEELSTMEDAARKLATMPPAYGADIFALRSNLERVRDRILASHKHAPVLTLQTVDKSVHKQSKKVPEKVKEEEKDSSQVPEKEIP